MRMMRWLNSSKNRNLPATITTRCWTPWIPLSARPVRSDRRYILLRRNERDGPEMDLVDVVEMIGNRLTQIDMAIARLSPSDPNAAELTALRQSLDQQQRLLVKLAFDVNTSRFQEASKDLKAVNDNLADSIQKIDRIATAIDDVTRFLTTVTNLVATASKVL